MNTIIKRLPEKILFFILFMFCNALTYAAPQININDPSSDVSSQNNVEFDISVVDSLSTYGFVNWDDSLIGYWRAEGNTNDDSRHANHGTFSGDAHIIDNGKFGKAFSFDGEGDAVNIGNKDAVDLHKTDSFTLSAWVHKVDQEGMCIVQKSRYFRLHYHGSKRWQFSLGRDESNYVYAPEQSPENRWIHVAVTYNASNNALSIYADGEHKMTSEKEVGDFSTASSLRIGGGIYAEVYYKGLIDEVIIFKRALSPNEIKALYEITNSRFINTFNDLTEFTTHSYLFNAVNANGERSNTEKKEILVDVPDTPPRVVLDYPLNDTREDSPKQTFKCTVFNTNRNTQLQRITFHWDYPGSFVADETKRVTGDTVSVEFTKTNLVGKTFEWNCSAVDTHNNSGFAPENFTYIVGRDEYHVAPNGDDNNPGTIVLPFRTIQKAAEIAMPGDTIYIRGGIYRETVIPQSSGNAFAPITFKGYPGEEAVISGADLITGEWTQHQDTIYKTTMDWDLGLGKNQIFVDGKAMMEARWPNADDVMLPNFLDIDSGTLEGSIATINDADLTQASGFWDGAIVHATWSPRYHAITGEVTSSSPGTLTMNLHCPWRGDINSYGIYYITGSYNALDKEEEWFYDTATSTLYLRAPNGTNLQNDIVEAKRRQYAFDLNGKSYINIEDLDIFASAITTDEYSHNIIIDNINTSYVTHYTLIDESNMGTGGKGVRDTGIILDGHDNIIKNSEIAYSAGNGVSLIGNDNTVHNCVIHDVNYVVTTCAAVNTGLRKTENNKITHNKLYNTGREIVYHDYAENLKILYNEMYNNRRGTEPWDMGATYAIATDGKGTEIAYNYIHDIRSIGIYLDGGPNRNFYIHHNIIWNMSYTRVKTGIHMNNPSTGHKIYHNTVVNGYISMNFPTTMEGTEIKNNICAGLRGSFPDAIIENNLLTNTTDPLFVDIDNADFHLQAGSPAIDTGLNLGFTEDVEGTSVPQGNAPDIGAYEYRQLKGDVNGDSKVNVQDVQCCVNHISGKQDWGSKADVDSDGKVNENDVREIIDIILGE